MPTLLLILMVMLDHDGVVQRRATTITRGPTPHRGTAPGVLGSRAVPLRLDRIPSPVLPAARSPLVVLSRCRAGTGANLAGSLTVAKKNSVVNPAAGRLIDRLQVAFEQARRADDAGREYWLAREYGAILGYTAGLRARHRPR
jgi:hypothetical protein